MSRRDKRVDHERKDLDGKPRRDFEDVGHGDGLWLEIEAADDGMPVGRIEEVLS